MGMSYVLGCPEGGEAQLQAAVLAVDRAMCRVRDAGKIKARDRIAVLAALNLTFEQTLPTVPPDRSENQADDDDRLSKLLERIDDLLKADDSLV